MIKANELRIGNWVDMRLIGIETDSTPMKVNAHCLVDIAGEKGAFLNKKCYEPIPLTPEILIAAGFTQLENKFTFDKEKLSIHLPSLSYKKGRTYFNSWCIVEHSIPYLHQLQNLYFALTGKELEIKILTPAAP